VITGIENDGRQERDEEYLGRETEERDDDSIVISVTVVVAVVAFVVVVVVVGFVHQEVEETSRQHADEECHASFRQE
jgi:hypothetical protein